MRRHCDNLNNNKQSRVGAMSELNDSSIDRSRLDGDLEDDDGDGEAGGSAFMSLLNSYYDAPAGDSNEADSKSNSTPSAGRSNSVDDSNFNDNIDTPHFNAERFAKKILTTKPMEQLIKLDNSMVHEIKALDSDMQMLVYENYNKFIGATETIKRMKTNVMAMDTDMESVNLKMEVISKKSKDLDASLADKRNQVDKLVRVSRLLRRLEFLSELPERLELMISNRSYKGAVELFNKSVNILEKHSHVLSFKNILERTQVMMTDLRGKVLATFEDPKLEVQELGTNVAVLRLLEAPPDLIVSKFLAAHKQRAGRIVKQFLVTLNTAEGDSSSVELTWAEMQSHRLESVRIFHQNFVLGLIEASRGVASVCKDVLAGKSSDRRGSHHPSEEGVVATSTDADCSAAVTAYEDLYAMIAIVLPDYTEALVRALGIFFNVYEDAVRSGESGGGRNIGSHSPVATGKAGENPMGTSVREEHRQRWISFARQIITDCLYIDQEVESMRPKEADRQLPLFDPLSTAVLHVLEQHQDCVFDKHVRGFLAAVCDYVGVISTLTEVDFTPPSTTGPSAGTSSSKAILESTVSKVQSASCDLAATKPVEKVPVIPVVDTANEEDVADSLNEKMNLSVDGQLDPYSVVGSSAHGLSSSAGKANAAPSARRDALGGVAPVVSNPNTTAAAKALLNTRFSQSRTVMDDLVNLFFTLFHSVCDDAQSLVEISAASKQHHQMRQQQWRWEHNGADLPGHNSNTDLGEGVTAAHLLLWRYADAISSALESYCGAMRVAGCVSTSHSRYASGPTPGGESYSDHGLFMDGWSSSGKNAGAGSMEIYTEPQGWFGEDDAVGHLSDSGSDSSEHSLGSVTSSRSSRAAGGRSHRTRSKKKGTKILKSASSRFSSAAALHGGEDGFDSVSTAIVALVASNVLAKVMPGMIPKMENSLRAFGMSIAGTGGGGSTNNSSRIREKVTNRVSLASHMLLLAFVENRAADMSAAMSLALSLGRRVEKLSRETLLGPRDLSITSGTMTVVKEIDRLAILCAVILGEAPAFNPPLQMRPIVPERRSNNVLGGAGSASASSLGQGQYHLQLQLDIERMFSRRIVVYSPESVSLSSDALMSAILKAAFKACEQTIRTYCLGNMSYTQLSMDAMFLKLVSVCFLKDSTEDVESLAEQVLQSISDANCSSEDPAPDTYIAIPKSVADGIYSASMSCLLLKK